MKKGHLKGLFMLLIVVLLAAGCGSNEGNGDSVNPGDDNGETIVEENPDPVTLQFMTYSGALSDYEFETFFAKTVNEKYPHITMERVPYAPSEGASVMNMIASGELPDILLSSTTGVLPLMDVGVVENLDPFVSKYKLDLEAFDPVTIDGIKTFTDEGNIIMLPYSMNFSALFYNKEIFDRFGIDYPKDHMTWDDAIALGRDLTRMDEGTQYRGLHPMGTDLMGFGLSLPYVDPETNTGLLESSEWQRVVRQVQDLYKMPGWAVEGNKMVPWQPFVKEQTIAMLADWGIGMVSRLKTMADDGTLFDWDMATIPNFPEALGYARTADFHSLIVTTTSTKKDAAFQAIAHVAADPEVQMIINKHGRVPVIKKSQEHQDTFGEELEILKGKNMNAVFGVTPSPLNKLTLYDGDGRNQIKRAARRAAWEGIDINTALREANDELNRIIKEKSGGQ